MSKQADKALQDKVNKTVWNACDTFRGTVDPSIYKDYVLTMLFVKYLSDVWQGHLEQLQQEHDDPELIKALLATERFQLPENAQFGTLYEARHTPGNG